MIKSQRIRWKIAHSKARLRQPSQAALVESEYAVLLRTTDNGFFVIDQDARILDCNEALCRMLGYSRTELLKMRVSDIEANNSPEVIAAQIQNTIHTSNVHFQSRHRRKNGTLIDVEISATYVQALGEQLYIFIYDITAAKQAERALQAEKTFVDAIMNSVPGIIYLYNAAGKLVRWNKRHELLTGYSGEELHSMSLLDWYKDDPASQQAVTLGVQNTLATGFGEAEAELQKKDGSIVSMYFTASPLVVDGETYFAGLGIDITERKLAELKLRENEEFNRRLIETANEGIWIFDRDLVTRSANPRMAEMLGYRLDELQGRAFTDFLLPEDLPDHERKMVERHRGEKGHYERRMVRIDGSVIWTLVSSTPMMTPEGVFNGAFGMFSDITERKNDEETILRFKTMFDLASYGAIIVTLDGFITYINTFFAEIHGYQPTELLGKHLSIFFGPESLVQLEARYKDLFTLGRLTGFEVLHLHRDGHEFPMSLNGLVLKDEFGAPAFIATTATDLTAQKQAEQKILEIQQNLVRAQRLAKLGSFIQDLEAGRGYWSDELFHLFGLEPAPNAPNLTEFLELVHPEDRQTVIDELTRISQTGVGNPIEYRSNPANGPGRVFISRIEPVLDENRRLVKSVGTIQDITERKEAENQIRKLNEELEQRVIERTAELSAANQELEAFSYSVSHDLRAPLRGIDGWSQALLEDYGPQLDAQAQSYIQRVRSEAQRMGRLIEDLLQLSRLARAEMFREPVDLSALAQGIAARLLESEPERQVRFEIQPGLKAYGDARLLEVALLNLLGNAFKFTGKTPAARIEFGEAEAASGPVPGGSTPAFFVRDNGAGFDMAYAGKLFSAFQRMHKASEFPGSGIGLATVQRIIHRHGGQVWAEASPDRGATFYFGLEEAP